MFAIGSASTLPTIKPKKGMTMVKFVKSIPMALAAAAILAVTPVPEGANLTSVAFAQDEAPKKKQKTRKVQAIPLAFQKKLEKIQETLQPEEMSEADLEATKTQRLARAIELLDDALEGRGVNDYARSIVYQYKAQVAFERDDTRGAIEAFETVLQFKESIPVAQEHGIMYNLAQLYYSVEELDKAIDYAQRWEAAVSEVDPALIGVTQKIFIGQLYYMKEDYGRTLEYIDAAIADAEAVDTIEVKENWYGLKLSAHYERSEFPQVRDTLITMIVNWPAPNYWVQLASVYQEMGEDESFYSLMEAAYKQGFLDEKPAQLVNVAQIQISRDAPIKCAWILNRALNEKLIEDTAENQKLLGQCYMAASDYRRALDPLSAAAEKDSDGDLWLQIGQVQMQVDRYEDAEKSFTKMQKAFEDDEENADKNAAKLLAGVMMHGQVLTELKRFDDAKRMFSKASRLSKTSRDRGAVASWRKYLAAEEAREQMLTGR